jgi:hypothetical protein
MKKLAYILCMMFTYFTLTSSSCNNDDNNNVAPINTTTPGSGWKVTLFSEPGENKTSHFSGYSFEFATNGSVSAVKNGLTINGTWLQYQNNGVTKFTISLNTTDKDLSELNDDWVLVSKSDTFISLKDDNSAKNEQLQFSK